MTIGQSTRSLRGLIGVLGAQAASFSANRLLLIAVPWFVLTTTGSVTKTGLIAFFQITPFLVAQTLAGPLIDRLGPRRVSIVGDAVSLAAAVTVPLLYAADALPLWALMALIAILGAGEGPATAAKAVFIPSVTRAANAPLERGTGLSAAVERTAVVLGPAAAGVVVNAFGGARAFWLAAALFGIAAVVTMATLADPPPDPTDATKDAAGYFARMREGATFLRGEGLLRAIVGMLLVTNLLDQAAITVLLPVWARNSGHGVGTVGLVVSIFGATSIPAALVAARYGHRLPRRPVYTVGFIIGGVPRFVAMALGIPLWAVVATFAVGGLGSGFINPIIGAVSYERIPNRLLGRVRTLATAVAWGGIPFGGLFGAAAVASAGLTGALWIVGGCYLLAILLPALRPEWSQMRPSPPAPRAPSEPATSEPAL